MFVIKKNEMINSSAIYWTSYVLIECNMLYKYTQYYLRYSQPKYLQINLCTFCKTAYTRRNFRQQAIYMYIILIQIIQKSPRNQAITYPTHIHIYTYTHSRSRWYTFSRHTFNNASERMCLRKSIKTFFKRALQRK